MDTAEFFEPSAQPMNPCTQAGREWRGGWGGACVLSEELFGSWERRVCMGRGTGGARRGGRLRCGTVGGAG